MFLVSEGGGQQLPEEGHTLDGSKAFDMCTLLEKLHKKGLPAIVIRTFIFIYEEQMAWVSWGTARSAQFGIVNGTRQGSVLSPSFFGVYIDDLLVELRKSGVGCHIGGKFLGAAGYADDLILLAPCRSAMAQMVKICEEFGEKNNLMFSTDTNPAKSKTKCLYVWAYGQEHCVCTLHQFSCMAETCPGSPIQHTWVMSCTKTATWTWTSR